MVAAAAPKTSTSTPTTTNSVESTRPARAAATALTAATAQPARDGPARVDRIDRRYPKFYQLPHDRRPSRPRAVVLRQQMLIPFPCSGNPGDRGELRQRHRALYRSGGRLQLAIEPLSPVDGGPQRSPARPFECELEVADAALLRPHLLGGLIAFG